MKTRNPWVLLLFLVMWVSNLSCGGGGGGSSNSLSGGPGNSPASLESNVLPISVDASCGVGSFNIPCVSITLCEPGTNNCQTIPRILIDTGSSGLRLIASEVSVKLSPVINAQNGDSLAQCHTFGDGTAFWGPVMKGDVGLAGLRSSTVSVQIINANFGSRPIQCLNATSGTADLGYNGILGISTMVEDCGSACEIDSNNQFYFACSSSSCDSTSIPRAMQVANPVAYLPSDNNGVTLKIQDIPSSGAMSAQGQMILGVGTRANNTVGGVKVLKAKEIGLINTLYKGSNYDVSLLDTGTNFYAFSDTLPTCQSGLLRGAYCPPAPVTLSAQLFGQNGEGSNTGTFEIVDQTGPITAGNFAFKNIGAEAGSYFIWGFPYFYGKTIQFGFEGKSSSLGVGPWVAY